MFRNLVHLPFFVYFVKCLSTICDWLFKMQFSQFHTQSILFWVGCFLLYTELLEKLLTFCQYEKVPCDYVIIRQGDVSDWLVPALRLFCAALHNIALNIKCFCSLICFHSSLYCCFNRRLMELDSLLNFMTDWCIMFLSYCYLQLYVGKPNCFVFILFRIDSNKMFSNNE